MFCLQIYHLTQKGSYILTEIFMQIPLLWYALLKFWALKHLKNFIKEAFSWGLSLYNKSKVWKYFITTESKYPYNLLSSAAKTQHSALAKSNLDQIFIVK